MSQSYTMNILNAIQSYLILIHKICNLVFSDENLCFRFAQCDFSIDNFNKKLLLVK